MAKRLTSVAAAIQHLGGTAYVARLVGVRNSAVSNWISDNRFPPRRYMQLSRELKRAGATVDESLWGFKQPEAAE
jgi:DNA-binding transcriptional regulator YdaS (Cro superfamily)